MHRCYKHELRIQGGKVSGPAPSVRHVYNNLSNKQLITLAEFKSYLENSTSINKQFFKRRSIEVMSAIALRNKRFVKYSPPEKNQQFATIYNAGTISKNRLLEMLSYFVGPMWADIIAVRIQHGNDDSDIFTHIKSHLQFSETVHTKIYRMNLICDAIYQAMGRSPKQLLDVGVGNGKKTQQMGEILECKVSGADIAQWGPYQKNKKFKFPYKQIQLSPYKIPYKDKSFDCITLVLVLHHCTDIITVINECKRLLAPGGVIALVEHDSWSDETNMLVDLQHRIYKELFNEQEDYYATYFNFYEWDILFAKCGMRSVSMNYITDDVSSFKRYDMQYISIYQMAS